MNDPVPEKFICTKDPYREFRGYVFAYGKPTVVRDRATIGILMTHPDYRRVTDEEVQREETAQEVQRTLPPGETLHAPAKRGWPLGRPRK